MRAAHFVYHAQNRGPSRTYLQISMVQLGLGVNVEMGFMDQNN